MLVRIPPPRQGRVGLFDEAIRLILPARGHSSPEVERAALRAENPRLRRLLDLAPEQGRPPTAAQTGLLLDRPAPVTASSSGGDEVRVAGGVYERMPLNGEPEDPPALLDGSVGCCDRKLVRVGVAPRGSAVDSSGVEDSDAGSGDTASQGDG